MKHGDLLAAYFTMEAGFYTDLKTYSGGLGILAGDFLKSAADLRVPISAVTPLYNFGYFDQVIRDKRQFEEYNRVDPIEFMTELPYTVNVEVEGRKVKVGVARMKYVGNTNFAQPQYFIFTKNNGRSWDDDITDKLYKKDRNDHHNYWRIAQEQVLGIGGVRMLHKLAEAGEISLPHIYHLNEGHAAFAPIELTKMYGKDKAKGMTVFTTHTPVPAGHDRFNYDKLESMLGRYFDGIDIRDLGGHDELNMTRLALNMSKYSNAVAKRHGIVSRKMFPEYPTIDSITNGVHSKTWTTRIFKKLYDEHFNGYNHPENWRSNPQLLEGIDKVPDEAILRAHTVAKARLLDYIKKKTGDELDEKKLTIGFARRFATYKRGDLMFRDLERLIDASNGQVQFVFSGKAHPTDEDGKNVITNVLNNAEKLKDKMKIVFLPNYEMDKAQMMIAGVDLWLNLPRRPLEASGTSGMKAAHNGVPSFSTADGWWDEVLKEKNGERIGGWTIGCDPTDNEQDCNDHDRWRQDNADFDSFCYRLKHDVLPAFKSPEEWARVMKGAIQNASYFNTHRMVKEYVEKAYGISINDAIVK
ncbi:MAG: alpha-glucan family phosphorylase [Candidatus Woesearchaeota archaeon]